MTAWLDEPAPFATNTSASLPRSTGARRVAVVKACLCCGLAGNYVDRLRRRDTARGRERGVLVLFSLHDRRNLPLHSIVGFLAVRDHPHDLNGVADYAGRARLAARAFGHSPSLYLMQ
jgi:hypothetical protein